MKDIFSTRICVRWTHVLKVIVLMMCILAMSPWVTNCRGENKKPADDNLPDFTKFSIEELMNVEIISVSKKPEKLSEVAAAVFVITQEDIRRSGATSIPEALRLAPGVHVARITSTDWAINIRGLNDRFANNLLVLIDGRSVYTPVFSGVFWDVQDTVLEDIERIEVIRGPGATLWGVNAVNGVINIITKKAQKTQGWQVSALGGDEEGIGSVRYGGASEKKDVYYRIYGKYFNRGRLAGIVQDNSNVQPTSDWQSGRVGFRADSEPGKAPATDPLNSFTLQGEAYKNEYKTNIDRVSLSPPFAILQSDTSKASGAHLLGRWQHKISATSDTILQIYYDHAMKDYDPSSGRIDTVDFDFQHRFHMLDQHDIVWGLGYRFISDKFDNTFEINMDPARRNQDLFSAFAQDEITLTPDQLFLIVGSKFEHNDFTGGAVRIPSRLEHDVSTNEFVVNLDTLPEPATIVTLGNSNLVSEKLIAYELGYRVQPINTLWLNTTVFFNDYEELIGLKSGDPIAVSDPTPHFIIPLTYENNLDGEAYGLEVSADWQAMRQWRLMASYSYLHTDLQGNDVGIDEFTQLFMRSNPRHQFSIRSLFDITEQIDFDLWLRYVGRLPELNIDDYVTIDARLAWRPVKNLELSVVGQNLFEEGHAEFSTLEVERSIYGKVVWSF
jgi:iron complex outermembrane receptor protein